MKTSFKPKGVCSVQINIDADNGIINHVDFVGGCSGNLQGICALIKGQSAKDVIACLEGIHCGSKKTSCPDQLAQALKSFV
ncbi:MAG: TIGR03905 family TSCPD domain-containing protein [Oscillospiraceae bacterium]